MLRYKVCCVVFCGLIFLTGCVAPHSIRDNNNAQVSEPFETDKIVVSNSPSNHRKIHETSTPVVVDAVTGTHALPGDAPASLQTFSSAVNSDKDKKAQVLLDEALDCVKLSQDFWQKGELEKAIDALDSAYNRLLEVNGAEEPQIIQQKEDLRFMISRRMLEIYAARNTVATGNHNAIPLDMNRYVQAEINLFTGKEKRFFIASYRRSGQYRPMIVKALEEAGLPTELSWLPLIESGFKVKALSRARALGLWQFIASTGYKFGLSRDRYIDERMDPEKATRGAIEYLRELHQIFGDWTTCLAAYNCGEGKVLRVIKSKNVNYLDNFWDLYQQLPRETARYVPRFLAALHIINNPAKYNMDLGEPDPPLEYESVMIAKQVHLNQVAKHIGVPVNTLKVLNAELRYQITPTTAYELKVPPKHRDILLVKISDIPKHSFPKQEYAYHKIRSGQTLSSIAKKYGVSQRAIAAANGITKKNRIVAGKSLKIPLSRSYTRSSGKKSVSPVVRTPASHVVRRGDSLWNLAKRYDTTVAAIRKANRLSSNRLSIGQTLKIPGKRPASPAGSKTYVVQSGDSPYTIARQHRMKLSRFLDINGLNKSCKIFPGQEVFVE